MCGIVGYYGCLDKGQSAGILRKMLTRIKHRGPDESGVYVSDIIALGSVRLSIIDLKSGPMPLSNEDRNLWIVFNGEIFNHIELRDELENKGHVFKTSSDTEVIVHLYEEYGQDFLHKLNGQFAIAIYDKKKEELFLARDRVGIRPLFYTEIENSFVFGSEIKSLLEFPNVKLSISPKAVSHYFTFWTTLSPNTPFEEVFELPPGSFMVINSKGKKIKRYWELSLCKLEEYKYLNVEDAAKDFEKIFSKIVKLRLRADVPVAAYLSGGLDSSVTTSFIKKISPESLNTFSIGFTEKDYDESIYQNIAVKYFNTEHASISCSPEVQYPEREDVIEVTVLAEKGIEYKFRSLKYGSIKYEWVTDNGIVYIDFHGEVKQDNPPKNVFYESYTLAYSNNMAGTLTAPFEGKHGWYFRNETKEDIVVTTKLNGQYELFK